MHHPHSYSSRRYFDFCSSAKRLYPPEITETIPCISQALCFPSALRGISDIPIFMILNSWCVAQRPRPRNHIASGSAGRQKNNSSIGDFYGFSHTHLAAKSLKLHCGNFRFIFTILLSQRVPRVYI